MGMNVGMGQFKVVRESFIEKVTSGQRHEEDEGASHGNVWQKCIPHRGRSKCKGPEAGVCIEHTGNREEVRWIE